MASTALRTQPSDLVNYMFTMDLLGDYFKQIQELEDDGSSHGFMAEIIPLFAHQVDGFLSQISKLLGEPLVDFLKVDALLNRLWENSAQCVKAMEEVRREFDEVYKKLQTMLQLKQQIQALDNKQIIGVSRL